MSEGFGGVFFPHIAMHTSMPMMVVTAPMVNRVLNTVTPGRENGKWHFKSCVRGVLSAPTLIRCQPKEKARTIAGFFIHLFSSDADGRSLPR